MWIHCSHSHSSGTRYRAEICPSDTCSAMPVLAPSTAALPASASAKKSTITQSFSSVGGWTWDSFQFHNSIIGECRRYDQVIKAATRSTLCSSVFMLIPGFRWAGAPHTSVEFVRHGQQSVLCITVSGDQTPCLLRTFLLPHLKWVAHGQVSKITTLR